VDPRQDQVRHQQPERHERPQVRPPLLGELVDQQEREPRGGERREPGEDAVDPPHRHVEALDRRLRTFGERSGHG
jgi:hypothetical protein